MDREGRSKAIRGMLLVCFLCVGVVAAGAQAKSRLRGGYVQVGCTPTLPPEIAKAISRRFSESHVLTLAEMGTDDRKLWTEAQNGKCPGVASGRFGGKEVSFALSLVRGSGPRLEQAVVLATPTAHGIAVHILSAWSTVGNVVVVYRLPAGSYQEVEGGRKIRSRWPVIAMEAMEAGVIIFYWQTGGFHALTIVE